VDLPVDGKIVLRAQYEGVTVSMDAANSQIILKKDATVVAVFTARVFHLHVEESGEEISYSPAITYDGSSDITIDVADKLGPVLLVFGVSAHVATGEKLLRFFKLKSSGDDDSDDSDIESDRDEKTNDKDKKNSSNKEKKGLKLGGFGIHFKKPSKTSAAVADSINVTPAAVVFANRNNEYFVVNPKVNMVCHITRDGLAYRGLVSSSVGNWKVRMNLVDLKVASLSAKSKRTVLVERTKSKELEIDEEVKYFDKADLTGILHSFHVTKGPANTPITITQNVTLKGIVDVIQDQKGITFCVNGGTPVLLYKYMDVFDATGKLLKSNMAFDVKKNLLTLKVSEAGEYPMLIQ